MSKSALVILANGCEELEATAPIDLLRRASVQVTVAAQEDHLMVIGRNGIAFLADNLLESALTQQYDLIVLPGGPGHIRLREDERLIESLQQHSERNGLIGAICAAPTILHEAGLLEGRRYTAHHSTGKELTKIIPGDAVVVDGNIITSRGAGTAIEFGLKLVELLIGKSTADEIAESIHYRPENLAVSQG